MKQLVHLLFVFSIPLQAMDQTITKEAFNPQTVANWNLLNSALITTAPSKNIDITTGLAAIINEMHTQKADSILDDKEVTERANEILKQLQLALPKFADKKLSQIEQAKLALTTLLAESFAQHQQELKLPQANTEQKIISSGEQGFKDNLELMELNSHLDTKKCSTEFKAFMTTYFYFLQQSNQ